MDAAWISELRASGCLVIDRARLHIHQSSLKQIIHVILTQHRSNQINQRRFYSGLIQYENSTDMDVSAAEETASLIC